MPKTRLGAQRPRCRHQGAACRRRLSIRDYRSRETVQLAVEGSGGRDGLKTVVGRAPGDGRGWPAARSFVTNTIGRDFHQGDNRGRRIGGTYPDEIQ